MKHSNKVVIDLSLCTSEEELLRAFGKAFEFGGPDGNHKTCVGDHSGWGMNWAALEDSLSCVDSGGIWGSSRKFAFPLALELTNTATIHEVGESYFARLIDILRATEKTYEREGLTFKFIVKQPYR